VYILYYSCVYLFFQLCISCITAVYILYYSCVYLVLQLYNHQSFYLAMDQDFIFDNILTDLQYLKANWQLLGRPTMILPIYTWMSGMELY